jgi:hypothetical protein
MPGVSRSASRRSRDSGGSYTPLPISLGNYLILPNRGDSVAIIGLSFRDDPKSHDEAPRTGVSVAMFVAVAATSY